MEKARKARTTKEDIDYGYDSDFPIVLRKLLQKTTQDKLAEHCGVARQSVAQWKDGKTKPDIYYLGKIADFFEVSTDYLLGLTPHDTPNVETRAIAEKLGLSEKAINNFIGHAQTYDSDCVPDENREYRYYELPPPPFVDIRNKFIEHYNFDKLIESMEKFIREFEEALCQEILLCCDYGQDITKKDEIKVGMDKMIEKPDFKHSDYMVNIGGVMYLMTQQLDKVVSDMFISCFNSRFEMIYKSVLLEASQGEYAEEVSDNGNSN